LIRHHSSCLPKPFLLSSNGRHINNSNSKHCILCIPAGVPRLFDLVSVSDPKLRLAFWYALRNTLVAADLDQASRIAYGCKDKRFSRVVTVAGQLIAGAACVF
jgi:chromosome segregation ATPase